jgi:acetyl esterase/lipase
VTLTRPQGRPLRRPLRRPVSRRGLLAISGAAAMLSGCGGGSGDDAGSESEDATAKTGPGEPQRVAYGEHPSQFADLRRPDKDARGTVVLLHGGGWQSEYGVSELQPLAERLTALGYLTWNVEYRSIGSGGGVPNTLLDVAAGIDRLGGAGLPAGITDRVVLLGHSAGGHLCVWAASRTPGTPGGAPLVRARGAISLAGILELTRGGDDPALTDTVSSFVGGTPLDVPERYAVADPAKLVPASCPVWAVRADQDELVPADQGSGYVAVAKAGGGTAKEVVVPGDHTSIAGPDAPSFPVIEKLVTRAMGTSGG